MSHSFSDSPKFKRDWACTRYGPACVLRWELARQFPLCKSDWYDKVRTQYGVSAFLPEVAGVPVPTGTGTPFLIWTGSGEQGIRASSSVPLAYIRIIHSISQTFIWQRRNSHFSFVRVKCCGWRVLPGYYRGTVRVDTYGWKPRGNLLRSCTTRVRTTDTPQTFWRYGEGTYTSVRLCGCPLKDTNIFVDL